MSSVLAAFRLVGWALGSGLPGGGPVAVVGGRRPLGWRAGGRRSVWSGGAFAGGDDRAGAGRDPLAELAAAVSEGGQEVGLEASAPAVATVGGVLSVGQSGLRRLGRGPVRDTVLEVTAVNSRGQLIRAGAPLVKNVTGFDLCRLLVGSLGTLAVLAEVVLRCRPVSEVEEWWVGEGADPLALVERLYRPLAVLWDGVRTWVGLAGYAVDVRDQAASVLGRGFALLDGPPEVPGPGRRSLAPAALRSLSGSGWLAEVGVGVVHGTVDAVAVAGRRRRLWSGVVDLHTRLKARFDPSGRLNPGRSVLP